MITGALRSLDDETAWTIVWGELPPGVERVGVTFRAGRASHPAARVGVLGRHWAAEVAGRFDKVVVTCDDGTSATAKVKPREKTPEPREPPVWRRFGGASAPAPVDPLDELKRHWGLAGLILQPDGVDRPMLPDLRSAEEHRGR